MNLSLSFELLKCFGHVRVYLHQKRTFIVPYFDQTRGAHQELSKCVLHIFIAIFLELLWAHDLNRRRIHGGSQIIELRIPWPQPNYWIENFTATMKLLNWAFRGHSQIIELRIPCHCQIIELRISWSPWNYWIENSEVAAKLLNWEFRGLSQIIELRISWPPWNYWIENSVATAKLLNWEFRGHHEIIELKIWQPPWNYWIENFKATAKLLNWEFHGHSQITELNWNVAVTVNLPWVCAESQNMFRSMSKWPVRPDFIPKMVIPKKEIFERVF